MKNLKKNWRKKNGEIDRLKRMVENRTEKTEKMGKKMQEVTGTINSLNSKVMALKFRGKVLDKTLVDNGFDAGKILEIDQTLCENLDKNIALCCQQLEANGGKAYTIPDWEDFLVHFYSTLLCLILIRHDNEIIYTLKVHFCTHKFTHTKNSLYVDVLLSPKSKPDEQRKLPSNKPSETQL